MSQSKDPMTDPQTAQAARDLVNAWVDRSLAIEDLLAKHPWLRDSLAHDIADALQKAHDAGAQGERAACAQCVPTNWCDPLLTGPDAFIKGSVNREIESLLRGIQARIRARGGA